MRINVAIYSFLLVYNYWKAKCLTQRNYGCSKFFDIWLLVINIAFGIWGCTIMFGDEYNRNFKWGSDYAGKSDYRKLFEGMVLIRFIGLLCCGCAMVCLICMLVPLILTASAADRQQRMQQASSLPVVGTLAHGFIDSKTREYDQKKDSGATCTICYADFSEEPDKPVAELNCSSKHIFHAECLKRWVATNNTCPLCKEVIPQDA